MNVNSSAAARMDSCGEPLHEALRQHRYLWPDTNLGQDPRWGYDSANESYIRTLPEAEEELAQDSRWPTLFPAPICLVTTADGEQVALEREVGASIVNRFPYVVALSLCHKDISSRHHARSRFQEILEAGGVASLQYLAPGAELEAAMQAINEVPDAQCHHRIEHSGLTSRPGVSNPAPVLDAAYMVYEARLVQPQKDFDGVDIYEQPWVDVGSHRIYFLEINTIQLRRDIAHGESQIKWRAIPAWESLDAGQSGTLDRSRVSADKYEKPYRPNYAFPARNTIAFEYDEIVNGMAIKHLPALPEDQVEVDNDRARWPCFFPSSCGLITSWTEDGLPNLMPCGSTTIVSRHPFVVAPCVSYTSINDRYAARKSLETIRRSGRFGCGVPYVGEQIIEAIKYAGNVSLVDDPHKVRHSGMTVEYSSYGPVLTESPIHFDCEVVGEVRLGTHIMFLGEVRRIRVRTDVTPDNPLEWCPWAGVVPVQD